MTFKRKAQILQGVVGICQHDDGMMGEQHMTWNETAYLSRKNPIATPSDLIIAVVSTARQNIAAAHSAIPREEVLGLHGSPLKNLNIYGSQADSHRAEDA